jgi:hypothetical protein
MSRAPVLAIALALAALSSVAAAAERGVSDAALAQAARDAWLNQIDNAFEMNWKQMHEPGFEPPANQDCD